MFAIIDHVHSPKTKLVNMQYLQVAEGIEASI